MAKKYILSRTQKLGTNHKPTAEPKFTINYQQQLNPAQYEAVCANEGIYLVIAGAGSGKTRTLVYRVARLVEMGYEPQSILLLTFTRKAAKEMMDRASLLLDNRCSKINGGTFHSFANITLRKYAKFVQLDNNFTILDQGDSEDVINLIRGQLKLGELKKRFPNKETLFKVFSLSVNTEKSIEDILINEYPHFSEYLDKFIEIQKIYTAYKRKNNLLDYDDLLIFLLKFLNELSPAAKSLLSTIKFTMVDEYQDTNKLQADIIRALAQVNKNVMVVGDDSQSIYSFRGANFKNIIDFPNLFENVKIITLEENYRSTQEILDFANHIIDQAIEKFPKHLFTKKYGGSLPAIIRAANENMQSRFIVERILELREEGIPLNEIAVLFRSSFSSFDLEIELNKANIPYIKFGGMKFIEAAHVKDILAFLRISHNPIDFVSWYRILLLHEGIGPRKAQQIMNEISEGKLNITSHPEKNVSSKYNEHIYRLFELLFQIHTKNQSPVDKLEAILVYYEPLFKNKYDDYNKRKKDLDMILTIAEHYKSIESFLTDMALEPPQDTVIDVEPGDKEKEYLTLSTIHSAKGLEWHTVFILNAIDGFFPSSFSFGNYEQLEEERRLMYVAVTRAKQNLYVSYPMQIFDRLSGVTLAKPSRFIENIEENKAEIWLLEEQY
ncbi:ATP-dependent helicase [Melioribacteraceae bacterium 4301-Me]|uniref:ATP-dependent helicase n=1 Tax=Pyranulibacter aquaticus TaxID=3163344 RepID=UPI0035963D69